MLRSVVGAAATNMMLVQCNSDMPISLACFAERAKVRTTASSEPRLWGPRRPAVSRASAGGPASQATFGAGPSERNSAPSTHMRCRMTPMRRASATTARFDLRRRAICAALVLNQVERPRCIMHPGGLAKIAPRVDVAGLGDPTRDITLTRLVSRGRQADT